MARPQNPAQYSDRLGFLYFGLGHLEPRLFKWSGVRDDWWILFPFCLAYNSVKLWCIERSLQALVHRTWFKTYSPTWSPAGPWRWFWMALNDEPPVPFMTINKWLCRLIFTLSAAFGVWSVVGIVTLYWIPLWPAEELLSRYVISFVGRAMGAYFG